ARHRHALCLCGGERAGPGVGDDPRALPVRDERGRRLLAVRLLRVGDLGDREAARAEREGPVEREAERLAAVVRLHHERQVEDAAPDLRDVLAGVRDDVGGAGAAAACGPADDHAHDRDEAERADHGVVVVVVAGVVVVGGGAVVVALGVVVVVPESVPGVVSAGRVVVSCEPPVSVVPVGFVSGGPFGSLPVVPERALSSSSPLLSTPTRTSCVARTSRSRERISSFESPSLPQLSISLRMSWSACFPSAVKWTGPSAAITNWYAVAKVSQSVQPAFAAAATFSGFISVVGPVTSTISMAIAVVWQELHEE